MGGRRGRLTLLICVLALTLTACSFFGGGDSTGGGSPEPTGITAPQEEELDLAYADQSQAQKLDLLLPERTGAPVPLVIAIHGGGWQLGDKREVESVVDPLRTQGYAVASINYRMSDEAKFPAAVIDAKAAVRWLRAHAGEYGLDDRRFAVWGFSAGGNLAALSGITGSGDQFGAPAPVQAVVDFYGPSDLIRMDEQFAADGHCTSVPLHHDSLDSAESLYLGARLGEVPERADEASPVHYVEGAQDIPPFYIAHGLDDCVVPDAQSTELADRLRDKGVRAQLTIVPGFGHADPAFDREQTGPAITFLESVLGRG